MPRPRDNFSRAVCAERQLLADAEAREDRAEQVVAGVGAGDFRERALRLAQLFGEQLAGARGGELDFALGEVRGDALQCFDVTRSGAEGAGTGLGGAGAGFQFRAQRVEAGARAGGDA